MESLCLIALDEWSIMVAMYLLYLYLWLAGKLRHFQLGPSSELDSTRLGSANNLTVTSRPALAAEIEFEGKFVLRIRSFHFPRIDYLLKNRRQTRGETTLQSFSIC